VCRGVGWLGSRGWLWYGRRLLYQYVLHNFENYHQVHATYGRRSRLGRCFFAFARCCRSVQTVIGGECVVPTRTWTWLKNFFESNVLFGNQGLSSHSEETIKVRFLRKECSNGTPRWRPAQLPPRLLYFHDLFATEMQQSRVAIVRVLRRRRNGSGERGAWLCWKEWLEGRDFGNVVLKKVAENSNLKMITGERAIGGTWY